MIALTFGFFFKFKVDLRIRNNESISKGKLLPEIVKLVGRPHIVDLQHPDILIIVEIFRVCLNLSESMRVVLYDISFVSLSF
jgi:tRNA acetyltransferase TAN1